MEHMEIDRRQLKRQAREDMGRARPSFWIVALVYVLLTTGVNYLLSALPLPGAESGFVFVSLFLTIFYFFYRTVVDFGFSLWSLWTSRHLDPGLGALVQGFSVAGRVLLMEIMIILRVLGWAICLTFCFAIVMMMSIPALAVVGLGAVYAAIWVIMLRYAFAPYLLADRPDDGAGTAVRRSISLTQGWKWQLFKLELSFFGWWILRWLLSCFALLFCLWQAGFFQSLVLLSPAELAEMLSGYYMWQNGFSPDLLGLSIDYLDLYPTLYSVSNSLSTALITDVLCLPLTLWLLPYYGTAHAGFYCERLRKQQDLAPPL